MPLREECRFRVLRECSGYLDLRAGKHQGTEENIVMKCFTVDTLELSQGG
jgi:hypothetical protein